MAFSCLATETSIFYSVNIWCDIFLNWQLFGWVSHLCSESVTYKWAFCFLRTYKHLPHILTCIQSHFLPPQGHFFAQVYLFKGRLSSQLLRWENLKMSWLDDPKRPLTEEMRKEARDHERLPSHTENCPQSWEFILFHLLFREISQLHWGNSKEWEKGTNFV